LLRPLYATPPQTAAPIPQFGKGAVVESPTVALIAEREPEAVVPVRKLAATKAGRKIVRMIRAKRIDDEGLA
jgi:hypothetical protein